MRILRLGAAWLGALLLLVWRATCRYRVVDDPRPSLRAAGRPYAYALLHAHQLAAVFVNDERRMAAMVSRSADGDLLVPSLTVRRVIAVRGSTRKKGVDKGGRAALASLGELAATRVPVLIAVDGPRGPRNHVHRGIADLALSTGAAILPTLVLPSARWFLRGTWDRFQLPRPFSTVRLVFGTPLSAAAGEDPDRLRERVRAALDELEQRWDPSEHALARAYEEGVAASRLEA